jgi:regulator of CtrA degradation
MVIDIANTNDENDRIRAFAGSDMFEKLFTDGMDLVEATAAYLDGDGRSESKKLDKVLALQYASESMRLTTRLMQAASWLLVQRAVREGEMTADDARDSKYRIGAKAICLSNRQISSELPAKLLDLLHKSDALYKRIDRLDNAMFVENEAKQANPVSDQIQRLHSAFGFGAK